MGVYSCKSCHTCIAVFKGIPQKGNLQLSHLAVQSQQMQIIHPMNQNWKQNSMRSIYEKNQMFELRLYIKVKNDHCSKFSKQLERRGLKKSRLQRNSNPWPPRNVAKRVACKTAILLLHSERVRRRTAVFAHYQERGNRPTYICQVKKIYIYLYLSSWKNHQFFFWLVSA